MIDYNRLGQEIKGDLTKFVCQMLYGILTFSKVHLFEIALSLKENIM